MKPFFPIILAALMMCHPLLLLAQETGSLQVSMQPDDCLIQLDDLGGANLLNTTLKEGDATLLLGGGEYPLVEVEVPIVASETTEVRGNLARAERFPAMLTIDEVPTRVNKELFYDEDDLLPEAKHDTLSTGRTFADMAGLSLLMPIVFPVMALGSVDEEETPNQSESDDDVLRVFFWIGCFVGAAILVAGLAGLMKGRRSVKSTPITANIEHNRSITDLAQTQADQRNFELVYEANSERLAMRKAAIEDCWVQYRVGKGPWVDVPLDLTEFSYQEPGTRE